MSIHLTTVPLPMDKIEKAVSINDLDVNSNSTDFKVSTPIVHQNIMEDILENNLLGFKNKQSLLNFKNKGVMYFYRRNGTIDIAFIGNYPKNDTICFVNHLNQEYLRLTNQPELYEEIAYDAGCFDEIHVNKFKIESNMKNEDIVKSILDESYVGYYSKDELLEFLNKGQFSIEKGNGGALEFVFIGDYDRNEARKFVDNLTDEYTSKVQEITYEKVLEKIREKRYILESENISEDDSIILTVNV